MLSHILSNVRLDAIDGNHVFAVGEIEGSRLKIGLGYKLFQIYLLRLNMPQVGGPLAHFTVHKGHSGGISIGFLHTVKSDLEHTTKESFELALSLSFIVLP